MSATSSMSWEDALALLQRRQKEVLFGFSPDVVRADLPQHPELEPAAMTLLTGVFVDGKNAGTETRLEPLLEGAVMILEAAGGYAQRLLDEVAFRIAHTRNYPTLIPMLIGAVDDATFERAVLDRLASEDDELVVRAIAIQSAAWGFPDRFTLSADGHAALGELMATLEANTTERPAISRQLVGYVAPPLRG